MSVISRLGNIFVAVGPFIAGLIGFGTSRLLLRGGGLLTAIIEIVAATVASFATVLTIRGTLRWIAGQESADCDMPMADADRIIGRWRYSPFAVLLLSSLAAMVLASWTRST